MASFLEDLFGNCPVCERLFRRHQVALIAEISHDGSEAQKEFLAAFERHNWDSILYRFQHEKEGFLPLRLFAIRCVTNRIALVVIAYVDVFEIRPEIFDYEILQQRESIGLLKSIRPEHWHSFDSNAQKAWERAKSITLSIMKRKA